MKQKIIDKIFHELSKNIEYKYPPLLLREEFEKSFTSVSELTYKQLQILKAEYDSVVNSPDDNIFLSMVKFTKENYLDQFPKENYRNSYPEEIQKKVDLERIEKGNKRMQDYDSILKARFDLSKLSLDFGYASAEKYVDKERWLISFHEFVRSKKDEYNVNTENAISSLFFNGIFNGYVISGEILENPDLFSSICTSLKNEYEKEHGKYMNLMETSKKYINRETILPSADWIVNIGHRRFYDGGGRGYYSRYVLENEYTVLNAGKKYTYVYKKDCKEINDIFANVFILSGNELLKISVGSTNLHQRTPYLISRDIQRIDITQGNVVEVHMHKHFDPETIIFDSEDDAYQFQTKLTSIREKGRNVGNYRK